MKQGIKKFFLILSAAMIVVVIAALFIKKQQTIKDVAVPKIQQQLQVLNTDLKQAAKNAEVDVKAKLPGQQAVDLAVPFTSQAPTGNWDQLHEETCEEASAIMANAYFSGVKDAKLDPAYVESEISKLTQWEDQNFGYDNSTNAEQTAKMIQAVYGLQTKLLNNFTENDVKNELSQGHLVIVPENGRALGNPYFKQPGPVYHMLVLKGFDNDNIVTNDPGTKRGANYIYSFNTIYNAAADWDHSKGSADQNVKTAIAVWK